jgi:hypothetical protein
MKMPRTTLPTACGMAARLPLPLLVGCALLLICGSMLACVTRAMGATTTRQTNGSSQAGAPSTGGSTPAVSVTLEQCASEGEQAERSATFSGEMTAIAGAARMAMRIEVQERMPGEELFHTVSAPGLGVWRGSEPGVKIYKYVKQVSNLSSPATYRALVHFHWLNDNGHVIRRTERRTPKCEQPAAVSTSALAVPGANTPSTTTSPSTTG